MKTPIYLLEATRMDGSTLISNGAGYWTNLDSILKEADRRNEAEKRLPSEAPFLKWGVVMTHARD